MEGISAINAQPKPVKKGKITKAQDVLEESRRIASDYLKNNPNASDEELRTEIRNSLQGRVSRKQLAQINSETAISIIRQYTQIAEVPIDTPVSTKMSTLQVPSSSIRAQYMPINTSNPIKTSNYYYHELPTTRQGWSKRHKKELKNVKSAFGNEQKYLEYLKRFPQIYEEEMAIRAQQAPKESNNAGKKQANAEYVSATKRKQQKKANEATSQSEHKKQRVTKDKSKRNEIYVAEHGIRAEETTGEPKRRRRRGRSSGGYSCNTSSPSHSTTSNTTSSVVNDTVKPGVKGNIDTTVKPTPGNGGKGGNGGGGKYWLIAAIVVGLSTLGYGLYAKYKNKQAENKA